MRTLHVMVGIAAMGGLLFGYETGLAVGALERGESSWLSTATLLGAMLGALASGRLADVIGRRDVIMVAGALATFGAFVSAIAPSELVLLLGRLVVGAAVGAVSVAAPLYIAEIAPNARRGRMICFFQLMVTIGILLAYVGLWAFPHGVTEWRFLLGAGAVLGLLLSGSALFLVESPVWLALMGDRQTAMAVQDRLGLTRSDRAIPQTASITGDSGIGGMSAAFSTAGRGAILLAVGLFFVQQFVGINAVIYYSPASLERLASARSEFGAPNATGVALAAVSVVATLVAVFLVDRVGRRPLLMGSLLGVAVGLAAMAVGSGIHTTSVGSTVSTAGLYVFIVAFAIGIGPIAWVAAAEVVPIGARGLALGVVVASHWLFDGLASPTGLLLRDELGLYLLIVLYIGCAIAGFVILRRLFPETKGRSLLAITRYFTDTARRAPQTRFAQYAVGVLGSLCGVLNGYNLAITAVTLVLIVDDWQLSGLQQGLLASTVVMGVAIGASIAGLLSDRFGRRYVLMSMAALFIASGFAAALAPSLGWLIAARAAAGVAMGVSAPTAGIYVAEVAPAAIRGRMLSIQIVANALGIILAYCVGLALVNRDDGWRAMFGFVALPAMIYGLALLPLLESPRWLIAAGQLNAARRSLRRLFGGDADRELAKIVDERADVDPDATKAEAGRERLWMPTHRPAVSVGLVLVFLSVFAGEDMVLFYAPTVLEQIGFTDTAVSFAATLGLGVISFIATLIAFTVIDQAGRKPMLISGLFVLAASLFVMAVLTQAPQTMSFARWGQVACLAVFVAAFGVTLGPICGIVISEIYPQSIRGRATSLTSSMQSVFAIVFTLTFPILLHAIGLTVTLVGYSVIGVAGALYLMRALPETKAKTLEEITDFWSRRTTAPHTAEV